MPLTLPGTLQGVNEATVYARSAGYVSRWVKDIGSSVKKGELLAEIAAPEVDQELSQAIATEQQTASSESLAKSTADRWKSLRDKDAVTQQDFDERRERLSSGAVQSCWRRRPTSRACATCRVFPRCWHPSMA